MPPAEARSIARFEEFTMRNQSTAHVGAVTGGPRAEGPAGRVLDVGPEIGDLRQHPITTLSAAVLKAARQGDRERWAGFAARAGVAPEVVHDAENGTRPAWALPYFEFTALTDAVSALNPALRDVFEVAAACDLILSCVLAGDQTFATDILMQPGSQDLVRALLRLAVTGESVVGLAGPGFAKLFGGCGPFAPSQVARLRQQAAALASSGSPDAWVGVEIAAICSGDQR